MKSCRNANFLYDEFSRGKMSACMNFCVGKMSMLKVSLGNFSISKIVLMMSLIGNFSVRKVVGGQFFYMKRFRWATFLYEKWSVGNFSI